MKSNYAQDNILRQDLRRPNYHVLGSKLYEHLLPVEICRKALGLSANLAQHL
jgi:hypothetical protein